MKKLLIMLALVACSDDLKPRPPPLTYGKCHGLSYDTFEGDLSMCAYEGYWWRCKSGSNSYKCVREAKLEAEGR